MKKWKIWFYVICLFLLGVLLGAVYRLNTAKPAAGSKHVTVEVKPESGEVTSYTADTDAEYLSGLMDELQKSAEFTYEASESEYGLYVTAVNGETADYNVNGKYWAIYVNGEYGSYGVSEQPVADGDTYTFAVEQG